MHYGNDRLRVTSRSYLRLPASAAVVLAALLMLMTAAPVAFGQDRVPREVRTYVPPDQIVTFQPSTSFSRFVDLLNPVFERVTGKQIVDPEQRTFPIGITVAAMHFFDAFELVLEYNDLTFRETDRYFIIEEAPDETDLRAPQQAAGVRGRQGAAADPDRPTHRTREIQINAMLFQIDHTLTRELGIDWRVLFPPLGGQGQTGGGGTGGAGQTDPRIPQIRVRTDRLFERFDDYVITPDEVDVAFLVNFFRALESVGAGETLAQPSVTVQSGREGRIQIGSDIPVTVRDFAGNTIPQFISTGIIVDVLPTLIASPLADSAGAPSLDFIHMNVQVENSSGRPFGEAVAIDRSTANTEVLLLDGEQTIIGGLFSVSLDNERRGVPILKDLPPWFFGLRYIFGYERKTQSQQELVIVLQAKLLNTLETRSDRPPQAD
ncbi:MAG: type II and III secretion system protein, partial [Bacteroidota bacterium]